MATDEQIDLAKRLIASFDGDYHQIGHLLGELKDQTQQVSDKTQTKVNVADRQSIPDYGDIIIEVDNVTKKYELGKQHIEALRSVSLQIRQGEFIALTGPSGSGKSTLLQLIGGLDKPTSGNIVIDGQNISKLSDRKISIFRNKTIGFVFQFFYLQPFLNTEVNITVPGMFARTNADQNTKHAQELADAVGLGERLKHLPKELSGGQMQRAAIARALLNKPKLLLADEPTGNLDRENGQAIIELFKLVRQRYGTTIIIVTHDPEIARGADREIKIQDGLIVGT